MSKTPKTMRDANGNDIPVKYVNKYDRTRDAKCKAIAKRFLTERKRMEQLVIDTLADIETIINSRELAVAPKGNFQTTSFDGLVQVSIDQNWHIQLDDRVRAARDLMLEYAKKLCAKAGPDAQALFEIVQEAFAANKAGGLSVGRVLSLCNRDIKAPEWIKARELLRDSISYDKGKRYIRVAMRPDTQHDFRMIRLDLSDCWPIGLDQAKESINA